MGRQKKDMRPMLFFAKNLVDLESCCNFANGLKGTVCSSYRPESH